MAETEEAVRRFLEGEEEAFDRIVRHWERKDIQPGMAYAGKPRGRSRYCPGDIPFRLQIHQQLARTGQFFNLDLQNHAESLPGPAKIPIFQPSRCRIWFPTRTEDAAELLKEIPAARDSSESLEALDIIRKALADLSEDHRAAIVLKEYLGLSLEELASVMNCPLSTAKSRLYHGLRDVQRNLKRMGIKFGES